VPLHARSDTREQSNARLPTNAVASEGAECHHRDCSANPREKSSLVRSVIGEMSKSSVRPRAIVQWLLSTDVELAPNVLLVRW
jgi:hypothetical protein